MLYCTINYILRISKMRESGQLEKIKEFWFGQKQDQSCGAATTEPFSMEKVAFLFALLTVAYILCLGILFFECLFRKPRGKVWFKNWNWKKQIKCSVNFWAALSDDFESKSLVPPTPLPFMMFYFDSLLLSARIQIELWKL